MKIKEFVKALANLAPSQEKLIAMGIEDKNVMKMFQANYLGIVLNKAQALKEEDFLSDLENYDLSHINVGMVSFAETPQNHTDFYLIGLVEVDYLVILKRNSEVVVVDYADSTHIIWKCAATIENFLDALIECAKFFRKRAINGEEFSSMQIKEISYEIAILAGATGYLDFYLMLLGYE